MCWAATGNGGAGRALNDEDSLNLDGMFYYSQQPNRPNSHSLGFQSLSQGPAKCMLRKAQTLARTSLEPCLELCWIIGTFIAGTLLESRSNLAGALLAGTSLEPCWKVIGSW